MYRGFNLKPEYYDPYEAFFYPLGIDIFSTYQNKVKKTLKEYILENDVLDGTKMQEDWFPQIEADVFLSHSHKDRNTAMALAGWLYQRFNIKTFIDSCIWGYSNDLLKLIDDQYCCSNFNNAYFYEARNYSTSHVHMMLSVALTKMIDKTECIFFLNTPNSISTSSIISKTESPWIYHEIATTQMIRKQIPSRLVFEEKQFFSKTKTLNESFIVQYEIDLSHLAEIDTNTLLEWENLFAKGAASKALDKLYQMKPVKGNNELIYG